MATAPPLSTYAAQSDLRSRLRLALILAMLLAAVTGVSTAELVFGNALAVAMLCAIAVVAILWLAPWTGVVALVIAATLIEQFSLVAEGTYSDGTDHIVLFQSLNAGAGLAGIYASPFEMFLALLLAVWLIKGFANRSLRLPVSAVGLSVAAFALVVALGWVRGATGGGSFQDSLLELRPWLYLTIAFLASSQLITKPKHVTVLLGVLAVGIGVKAVQGVATLLEHYDRRPQSILAHEEAFFFGLFLAILAALWLIPMKGKLRTVMTLLFPFVLVADVANQRRTAWAIAAAVLFAVFVVCFWGFPERRRVIAGFAVMGCVLAGVYWLLFSNSPGLAGQPARAVLSQLLPSDRDLQSNQYRIVENVNLGIAIRQTMPFGTGFGHRIPEAVPNVDISDIDSFISYLPHNGVLYVWLRLGLPGIVAFWMMVAIALMTASNVFRRRQDHVSLMISVTLMAALIAYVVQGFFDMGLYWFRIATLIGCLMGTLEATRRFDLKQVVSDGPTKAVRSGGQGVPASDLPSAA